MDDRARETRKGEIDILQMHEKKTISRALPKLRAASDRRRWIYFIHLDETKLNAAQEKAMTRGLAPHSATMDEWLAPCGSLAGQRSVN